jgi:hypothetical protein
MATALAVMVSVARRRLPSFAHGNGMEYLAAGLFTHNMEINSTP